MASHIVASFFGSNYVSLLIQHQDGGAEAEAVMRLNDMNPDLTQAI